MTMSKSELEARVLHISRLLVASQWSEDDFVEFKQQWPADDGLQKWGRRLAAHCNAALGHPVLWIIGLHERDGVCGATHRDRAEWLPKLQRCFDDGFAPSIIHDINVPIGDKSVTALLFASDRAPYVMKAISMDPAGGGLAIKEVPWREGTSVRSAGRQDLMRLLYGRKKPARVQVLKASIELRPIIEEPGTVECMITVQAYVSPPPATRFVWPFHMCGVRLIGSPEFGVFQAPAEISEAWFDAGPPLENLPWPTSDYTEKKSRALHITNHEAILDGPSAIFIKAGTVCEATGLPSKTIHVRCALIDAEDESATIAEVEVLPYGKSVETGLPNAWRYQQPHDAVGYQSGNPLLRALEIPDFRDPETFKKVGWNDDALDGKAADKG